MYPKHRPAKPSTLPLLLPVFIRRCRDEQVLSHKLDTRRVLCRYSDLANHFARQAIDAQNHALAVKRLPDVALNVDAQTVRLRRARGMLVVYAFVRHGTGERIIVKGEELPRGRVRKVHGA